MNRYRFFGILLILITACAAPVQPTDEPAEPPTAAAMPTSQLAVESTSQATMEVISEATMEPKRPFSNLPDLGEAPELLNEVWINSDGPVTLADSRGKVVLLEFWTFG